MKHVFISYCHDNKPMVSKLRDDLISAGETVWWDDEIPGGAEWKLEIRRALENAYAIVVCFTEDTDSRRQSGIFPELLDAIEFYRSYAPGSIFLIPVKLSNCEVPDLAIDARRTLKDLQFIELYPQQNYNKNIVKLVNSIKSAPNHP